MAGHVKIVQFQDFSLKVKAAINETSIAWLEEVAKEVTSHAQKHCSLGESYSDDLRKSYTNKVYGAQGKAEVYSTLEQAFWEEFGTGEHADTKKNGGKQGRKGWWVYKDDYQGKGGAILSEAEAKAIAASSDGSVHATNGREPHYTLEKAYLARKAWAVRRLKEKMGEDLG